MTPVVQHRPLLTLEQVAGRLVVSERTVRRLVAFGNLPALRVGSQIRVDQDELEDWLHADPDASRSSRRPSPAERRELHSLAGEKSSRQPAGLEENV